MNRHPSSDRSERRTHPADNPRRTAPPSYADAPRRRPQDASGARSGGASRVHSSGYRSDTARRTGGYSSTSRGYPPRPGARPTGSQYAQRSSGYPSRSQSSGAYRQPPRKPTSPPRRSSQRAKQRRQRLLIVLACLAVVLGFGIRHLYLMISVGAFNPTYVDNIAIYGVSLAGCDREEGKALILALEEEWKNEVYTFSYRNQSWNFSRSMVDADMECESRLEQAWNLGHIGSLSERKRQIDALARNPQNLMPTLSYDEQKLDAFVDEICAAIDVEPVDAVVVPDVNQPLVISESSTGLRVDREQLKTQLVTLIQTGQSDTALPVDTLFPNVSSDQLSFQQIAYCQTDTTFRNSASRSNVRLALNAFNGLVVQPGESCDFNEIVGPRTEKRGFQKAIEFAGDETVEGIGGGVCQASTTLYNALVQADMTILERRQHGMTVSYAEPSLDAAVSENGKNLIFKNETDYPIYIYTSVDSEWAKVTIYGHRPDYRYVLENVITEENIPSTRKIAEPDYSGTYVYFTDDPPVLQSEGKPGCRSQGWVVAYDWDTGEEVSRVHVSTDNYNPGVSTYWIGTHDRATEFAGVGTNPNY